MTKWPPEMTVREHVKRVLGDFNTGMTPREVADVLEADDLAQYQTVRAVMPRMAEAGELEKSRGGVYSLPPTPVDGAGILKQSTKAAYPKHLLRPDQSQPDDGFMVVGEHIDHESLDEKGEVRYRVRIVFEARGTRREGGA